MAFGVGEIIGVVGVAGIPATLALTMPATTHREFLFLKGCLLLSGALIVISLFLIEWSEKVGIEMRVLVNAAVAALVVGGLTYGMDWLQKKQGDTVATGSAAAQTPTVSNKNGPTINAGGNVTIEHIGDVTINQAPAPRLELIQSTRAQSIDGTFESQFIVGVVSLYPPSRMQIIARAPGVLAINITPDGTGFMSNKSTSVAKDESYGAVAVSSMNKRFRLTVKTKSAANIALESAFE
jgi:hypothetical protein